MIKKLSKCDFSEFNDFTADVPRNAFFNWSNEDLQRTLELYSCWGFFFEEQLVSTVCLQETPEFLEIVWLATRNSAINRGHMKTLLGHLFFDVLRHKDSVLLEVHEGNLFALKLYRSLGFEEEGLRKNYYKDGASAVLMGLKLK